MKKIFLLCMLCLLKFNNANAQTEVEPNGIWNQSLAITLGNTADGSAGLGHEEDWWRVSIPEDGALTVNWQSNGFHLYCQIYDTLGTVVLFSNYTNGSSSGTASGIAKGTYYIRMVNYYPVKFQIIHLRHHLLLHRLLMMQSLTAHSQQQILSIEFNNNRSLSLLFQ
ncbi:MAG: hypothetical protein IPL24_12830 [Bacteroidetes bacterium]|nr:hypothetical protein [Bacteroidota bacterium]